MGLKIQIRTVHWKRCWRAIPTRYPSENLLERVVDVKDNSKIEQLDRLTSNRIRFEQNEVNFPSFSKKEQGPGSRYIRASLAYSLLNKSRFGGGAYGIYYGANSLTTAVEETKFHREKFLQATHEGPLMLPMRVVIVALNGSLHDIRKMKKKYPGVYSVKDYDQSQKFSQKLWEQGSNGIVYSSTRHLDGECVAVFNPSLLSHCRQERQLIYEWNGHKIIMVYELQEYLSWRQ